MFEYFIHDTLMRVNLLWETGQLSVKTAEILIQPSSINGSNEHYRTLGKGDNSTVYNSKNSQ